MNDGRDYFPGRDEEVRTTSATGGEKGMKQSQIGALDPLALLEVGRVAGFGATKYARHNFLKGYEWSLSFDALLRHLMAWNAGEDIDPESRLPHMAHAAWHTLALISFSVREIGTDDRPPRQRPLLPATPEWEAAAAPPRERCVFSLSGGDGMPCNLFREDIIHSAASQHTGCRDPLKHHVFERGA